MVVCIFFLVEIVIYVLWLYAWASDFLKIWYYFALVGILIVIGLLFLVISTKRLFHLVKYNRNSPHEIESCIDND